MALHRRSRFISVTFYQRIDDRQMLVIGETPRNAPPEKFGAILKVYNDRCEFWIAACFRDETM